MGTKKTKAKTRSAGDATKVAKRQLTLATRRQPYAARRYLGLDALKELGPRMSRSIARNPRVAFEFKNVGIDHQFTTLWEPGLSLLLYSTSCVQIESGLSSFTTIISKWARTRYRCRSILGRRGVVAPKRVLSG
jgi:hypothetical protein